MNLPRVMPGNTRAPDVTIRPTAIRETWKFIGELPHEARCHHCGATRGPDLRDSLSRWAEKHLLEEHGITVAAGYEVPVGEEHWPS